MSFKPQSWKDGQSGGTPITAAALNRLEAGVSDVDSRVKALEDAPGGAALAGRVSVMEGAQEQQRSAITQAVTASGEAKAAAVALEARVQKIESSPAPGVGGFHIVNHGDGTASIENN